MMQFRRSFTARALCLVLLLAFVQTGCYNTYFIDKSELKKLESSVEQPEVVTVYGDCASTGQASLEQPVKYWAQAEGAAEGDAPAAAAPEGEKVASDATPVEASSDRPGCEKVPVSTANGVTVLTQDGKEHRVTPFNFIMSGEQLVSPEYDLLLGLKSVDGAEVKEFSTVKTVITIVGVTAATVGTFVAISVLAPEGQAFSN